MSQASTQQAISLCDALDRLLTKGVVIHGDISISVAGVDLLYIGLRGMIASIDALDERPASLQARNDRDAERQTGIVDQPRKAG